LGASTEIGAHAQNLGCAQKNQSSNFVRLQKNKQLCASAEKSIKQFCVHAENHLGNSARAHIPAEIQCAQDLE
jgi:hypothetical protein